MNVNDKYPELFDIKDKSYGTLDVTKPTIIFMDGVGVTRNHKVFNLIQKNSYTSILSSCADILLSKLYLECTYYAALDEISFIFHNTQFLIDTMKMGNTKNYILSTFSQRFLKLLWGEGRDFPRTILKTTIFNIPSDKIDEYIKYRQEVCHNNSIVYVAKEFLDKNLYHDKEPDEIIAILKEKHLYDEILLSNQTLYEGILKKIQMNQSDEYFDSIFS